MLKMFLCALLAAVAAFVIVLAVGIWRESSSYETRPPDHTQTNPEAKGSNEPDKPKETRRESFWRKTINDPINVFTLALVFFTLVLAVSTTWLGVSTSSLTDFAEEQAADMKRSLKIAIDTAEAAKTSAGVAKANLFEVQRAFVFPIEIARIRRSDSAGKLIGWEFHPQWKNSGVTPAKNVTLRAAMRNIDHEIAADYPFPESMQAENGYIGPQGILNSAPFGVLPEAMAQIRMGTQFSYLWGSAEYDDTFSGTPRHRVEFCFQILVGGDINSDSAQFAFIPRAGRNRAYDIDRAQPREEYKGPETKALIPGQQGTALTLPPKPLRP